MARGRVHRLPALGCAVLAALGLYPGSVFTSPCAMVPMLGLAGLVLGVFWLREVIISRTRWWIAAILALAVVGVGEAANYYVIARMAFPLFRSSFEQRAADLVRDPGSRASNEWIAIYPVDEMACDPRGGVYFRVNKGARFIDEISCGFAWRPNTEGTPFGNARYRRIPLGHEWFIFWADDDW